MRIRAVLFDLDGTLLDTLVDLAAALNRALAQLGLPQHSRQACCHLVGDGARLLCERALPDDERRPEQIERLLHLFSADYAQNWAVATRVFDGIDALLAGLRARGVRLGVLSNKPDRYMSAIQRHFFPDTGFENFRGQREGVARKPDPAGALLAAREMGLPVAEFLYVGDSCVDMQTAVRAGMVACGALWGYRSEQELRENGARHLVARPEEILALFSDA